MKKINALIRPLQWEEARAALDTLGVAATLREVRTFGHLPARRAVYRGSAYVLETAAELELTMLVRDERLESTLAAIQEVASDAEITVSAVERVIGGLGERTVRGPRNDAAKVAMQPRTTRVA